MNHVERLLVRANILLELGQPLPVDLQAELMEEGIDVGALEAEHEGDPVDTDD